jgi:hypothetical protein
MSDLYDTDFVTWSRQQSDLLRRRAPGELVNEAEIDWPNVAEEIEALGKNEARALAGKLATILEHLLKLEASQAVEPRAGWRATIRRERTDIHRLLKDAPSLRRTVAGVIAEELGGGTGRRPTRGSRFACGQWRDTAHRHRGRRVFRGAGTRRLVAVSRPRRL